MTELSRWGVKSGYDATATRIALQRLKEAEATGANILVSACPFCKHNFQDAVKMYKSRLQILDITELVAEAVKQLPGHGKRS